MLYKSCGIPRNENCANDMRTTNLERETWSMRRTTSVMLFCFTTLRFSLFLLPSHAYMFYLV